MNSTIILKGNILYTPRPSEFVAIQHGYVIAVDGVVAVSYTHLDVYKRQMKLTVWMKTSLQLLNTVYLQQQV